jgi:transposase-like protein
MMEEGGLAIDHTTIYRWVQRYAPELEKRRRPQMNMIRKGQIEGVDKGAIQGQVRFVSNLFMIAA